MLGHLRGDATQSMKIRLAEPDDCWVLRRIDEISFGDYLPELAFREMMQKPGIQIRIMRNEYGHSAGLIVTEHGRGYIEIVRIAVRPVDRRRGLAECVVKLMQANLTRSSRLICKVDLSNVAMWSLLRKTGWYGMPVPKTDVIRFEWREPFSPK